MSEVVVLADAGAVLDLAPLRAAGAHVVRVVVAAPPAVWGAGDVYVAPSGGSPASRILGRAGRAADRALHRPTVITPLPRTAMPGAPVLWKHWLSAALAQTTSVLRRHPGATVVVAEGERAELIGWHLVRRRPELVVVAGCGPAALMVEAGPPTGDVSLVAPLIRESHALYTAVPDSPAAPAVVVVTAGEPAGPVGPHEVLVVVGDEGTPSVTLADDRRTVLLRRPATADAEAERFVLTGRLPAAADGAASAPGSASAHLLIGPANFSGQGAAWARCLGSTSDLVARNVAVVSSASPFDFQADVRVLDTEWPDPALRARLTAREIVPATHVLAEGMRPIAALGTEGWVHPASVAGAVREVERLVESGRTVGVVLHGSEARSPDAHLALYPFSPFDLPGHDAEWAKRRTQTAAVHEALGRIDVARFVTTPDMVDFVPGATWLPVVLAAGNFRPGRPLFCGPLPVVLHAPSSGVLKGSGFVDEVLSALEAEGVLTYHRVTGVPSYELLASIRAADVVVDQIVLGNNGVLATQALAAGRVVVGHLLPQVRERYAVPVPVVEANPDTLREVLLDVVGDRARSAEIAAQGTGFARTFHDGTRARAVLESFVGR